ncbi:MAG TPA: TIGR03435 family protein, partial [Bryobacteraceae bacterium]|nr:TIGR03435 family protein [Bryobacteraceae bacterium]
GPMNQLMVGSGQLIAHGVTLSQFGGHLSNFVDREVIDKTGLTELYDIKLECTSERAQMTSDDAAVSASAPSIFVALRQLGLKLEPEKAPGEVLVVDSLERPSQN